MKNTAIMCFGPKWAKYTWLPEIIKWTVCTCALQQKPFFLSFWVWSPTGLAQDWYKAAVPAVTHCSRWIFEMCPDDLLERTHILSYRKVLKTQSVNYCLFFQPHWAATIFLSVEKTVPDRYGQIPYIRTTLPPPPPTTLIYMYVSPKKHSNFLRTCLLYDIQSTLRVTYHMEKWAIYMPASKMHTDLPAVIPLSRNLLVEDSHI